MRGMLSSKSKTWDERKFVLSVLNGRVDDLERYGSLPADSIAASIHNVSKR